jgi:hypothetical protein
MQYLQIKEYIVLLLHIYIKREFWDHFVIEVVRILTEHSCSFICRCNDKDNFLNEAYHHEEIKLSQ